jgi:hypothetical protein
VYVNRCWLEFTGRRLEQERGHGWLEGVHPDDLDRCLAAHRGALAVRGALQVDYRLRVAEAHYRRVAQSGLAQSDARGRFEGYVTALLDVTGREDAEQTLRRSKALRFAAFQSLPGEVVVIAKDGRVVAMNGSRGAGEAPTAADPDAPSLGSNYRSACRRAAAQGDGAAQGVLQGLEAVLTGGQARFVLEYARPGLEGSPRWFELLIYPVKSPVNGAILLRLDVTGRHLAETFVRCLVRRDLPEAKRVLQGLIGAVQPAGKAATDRVEQGSFCTR